MIKKFFKGVWRSITVLRVALTNLLFIALLVILWLTFTDTPAPLPERAALLLNPVGRVVDERTRIETASLLFEEDPANREVILADLIDSVELAREDARIVALVMNLDGLVAMGQSKTTELADALARFRESGKPVVAVGDYFTQDQYRLAVEADAVMMHPYGAVALEGFSYYGNYFAEALDKLAVKVHVFRAGEFKSIAEPLLRDDMSPGEREITREWLGDIWRSYVSSIEVRRGLEQDSIDELLDNYPERLRAAGGNVAQLALETGLVDELLDRSQQNEYLSALVGARDDAGNFAAISFEDYLPRVRKRSLMPGTPTVAVVTAQGNILPGEQPPGAIGGDTLARLLRETAERSGTRAIVLRINSGGGSVFASEVIREELERIRKSGMPVVASMGSVAASGGYYIASAADRILATPTTITGSIGVFAAFPTVDGLLAKGGIHTDGIGTTSLAGGLRPDRPLSAEVADTLQQSVDDLYEKFLALVMESRGLDRETLDGLAEGRVLSAPDARAAGLVDELGSLADAVDDAAEIAGLAPGSYDVITVQPAFSPRQLLLQQISDSLGVDVTMLLPRSVQKSVQRSVKKSLQQSLSQRWFGPLSKSLDLMNSFDDPRHVYMRCLACEL